MEKLKMRLATFYFYRKAQKLSIQELISEQDTIKKIGNFEGNLPFKFLDGMDDILDRYNELEKAKTKHLKIIDICYLIVNLDKGEEFVKKETDKIRRSKGFIRFLTKDDYEREKNYTEND
jgi:hypothetical protein